MGGDGGVPVMMAGVARAYQRAADLKFLLVGDEAAIRAELGAYPGLDQACRIIHADEQISGTEKPSQALRRAKTTSMGIAVDMVKQGEAAAAVSSGNTGALMAIAKLGLRTLPGIDRPALAAMMPSLGDQDVIMLDLGANTECDASNLVQFALMGAAYARTMLEKPSPRVALLNIGTEELKGTDNIRDAAAALRAGGHLPMNFVGFIEGNQLSRGDVDVIVCDGFSGNIALKTAEGTARFVADLLRRAFQSSLRSKIGFLISRPATDLLRSHLDPNNHNGAVFLGLNGLVVKSHGGATATGVAHAIGVAAKLVRDNLTQRISDDLSNFEAMAA